MSKFKLLILILFFPSVLNILAQEKKVLTVEECVNIGLEKNKTLFISRAKVEYANAKTSEINAGMLPSLKFSGSYSRLSEVDPFSITIPTGPTTTQEYIIAPTILNNYTTKLSLQQPIFTGFRLESNSDLMHYNALASMEDYDKDKSQLIYDIKNAYWSYFKANEFLKNVDENIEQVKAHLSDVESFFNRGLATNNDVLKVKVQLANLRVLRLDAANNVQLSMMALNNSMGMPVSEEITVSSKIEYKSYENIAMNNLITKALENRHELKGMDLRIKAGEAGVKLAQSGWYPQVSFGANYYYLNPNSRIFPPKEQFLGTWDVGLNISYDIWNWQTASYQSAQAEAQLEQSKYSISQIKDAIVLDVSQSYLNLTKSKERIEVSDEAVKQAEENYRVTNEKFKSGVALNSDLIDAEAALLQAKVNYSSSLAEFEIAIARLEKAIGK